MKTILEVKNLSVSFGNEEIIHNLSLSLNQQEVLVILGPNGAGKTTLLRALLNLIPYQGSIKWHAKKISYLPPQELLVRQELPPLSVQEFFAFKKASLSQIKGILQNVGLPEHILYKQFATLSTGQFQRMLIAWALVDEPQVLLFDEPTSGIDLGGEETIYTLLHKFWETKKLTILLVTHDLSIVWAHATKVLCLNKQQLCLGPPQQILTQEKLKELYGAEIKFYKHRHSND